MSANNTEPKSEGIDRDQHGWVALKVLAYVMGGGIVALAVMAADTPNTPAFLRTLSVSALSAGAFAFLGGLLGFVFGIPRSPQGDSGIPGEAEPDPASAAERSKAQFHHNTNLEDISDWLTKILVGVGLTQLTVFPDHLWDVAGVIAPGLGSGDHVQLLALAAIIYYSTAGFLFGYLWTRLYLKGALAQADLGALARRFSKLEAQSSKDANALNLVRLQLNPGTDSPDSDVNALKSAILASSPAVKTVVFQQAGEIRTKYWNTDKARMERTIPIFEALVESDPHDHANHAQLGWALKDQRTPQWAAAERELSTAIELRGAWQQSGWFYYEASRAICRIMMTKDPQHASQVKSEDILSDLRVAARLSPQENFTEQDTNVLGWLKGEGMTIEEITEPL